MSVFITGVAGFIGMNLAEALLMRGEAVLGIDTCQSDPVMAKARLARLKVHRRFVHEFVDITHQTTLENFFRCHPDIHTVIHLAACGGVRRSRQEPEIFVHTNVQGHVSLLEACRVLRRLSHILYASSSAVYGRSVHLPFREDDSLGPPSSFYAVTKRTNEMTAETYSHLYGFAQTGLRLFTVYGPWGRPDMAYYRFACAIRDGQEVTLWKDETLARDFTCIDDVVTAVLQLMEHPPLSGEARLLNIGRGKPERVLSLVRNLEKALGKRANLVSQARPSEDMECTWASTKALEGLCVWRPVVNFDDGIQRFSKWFCESSPV